LKNVRALKKGWATLYRWLREKYGVFFYVCVLETTRSRMI
jgi:hypothetical protein